MIKKIFKSEDFALSGDGSAAEWELTEWQVMSCVTECDSAYSTRTKILYSEKGMYFLFDCEDQVLTNTLTEDMAPIYTEDAVEIFLDPAHDQSGTQRVYLEYELSPLDKELPLMVPNGGAGFHGWLPCNYEGDRRVRHATNVVGGKRSPMASCTGWQAECFIPFKLLTGLANTPPTKGTQWRGNLYRIDYDLGNVKHWALDEATGTNFHDYANFCTFEFC